MAGLGRRREPCSSCKVRAREATNAENRRDKAGSGEEQRYRAAEASHADLGRGGQEPLERRTQFRSVRRLRASRRKRGLRRAARRRELSGGEAKEEEPAWWNDTGRPGLLAAGASTYTECIRGLNRRSLRCRRARGGEQGAGAMRRELVHPLHLASPAEPKQSTNSPAQQSSLGSLDESQPAECRRRSALPSALALPASPTSSAASTAQTATWAARARLPRPTRPSPSRRVPLPASGSPRADVPSTGAVLPSSRRASRPQCGTRSPRCAPEPRYSSPKCAADPLLAPSTCRSPRRKVRSTFLAPSAPLAR